MFQYFGDIDAERCIDGVLEYLPMISIPDFTLVKYVTALESIIDYEWILQRVRQAWKSWNWG